MAVTRSATFALVMAVCLACAATATAARNLRGTIYSAQPSTTLIGGFVTGNVFDEGAIAASNWVRDQVEANAVNDAVIAARNGKVSLIRIKDVETQVVAGLNYKLVVVLRDAALNKYNVNAVVYYVPWTKTYSLSFFQATLVSKQN